MREEHTEIYSEPGPSMFGAGRVVREDGRVECWDGSGAWLLDPTGTYVVDILGMGGPVRPRES